MKVQDSKNPYLLSLASGICLGLAIFTKITAFTIIPLVAIMVYFNGNKSVKTLILWILPVVLIPFIWPLQAIDANQFDLWLRDVVGQSQRHSLGLPYISQIFLQFDPLLFILGIAGITFATVRKKYFVLAWIAPFALFLLFIGYNQYFYWIPVLPAFCISAAIFIVEIPKFVKKEKLYKTLVFSVVSVIAIFGLISTTLLVSTNVSDSEFQATSYVVQNVNGDDTTVLASPTYSWILNYVFHKENVLLDYSLALFQPITTPKVLLVADPHFIIDMGRGQQLQQIYNDTKTVITFDGHVSKYDLSKYPYVNLQVNEEGSYITIKTK